MQSIAQMARLTARLVQLLLEAPAQYNAADRLEGAHVGVNPVWQRPVSSRSDRRSLRVQVVVSVQVVLRDLLPSPFERLNFER
jgi:hypothetical protein